MLISSHSLHVHRFVGSTDLGRTNVICCILIYFKKLPEHVCGCLGPCVITADKNYKYHKVAWNTLPEVFLKSQYKWYSREEKKRFNYDNVWGFSVSEYLKNKEQHKEQHWKVVLAPLVWKVKWCKDPNHSLGSQVQTPYHSLVNIYRENLQFFICHRNLFFFC